jgi:hypothetical protein
LYVILYSEAFQEIGRLFIFMPLKKIRHKNKNTDDPKVLTRTLGSSIKK